MPDRERKKDGHISTGLLFFWAFIAVNKEIQKILKKASPHQATTTS
jgi:hypothetical protein